MTAAAPDPQGAPGSARLRASYARCRGIARAHGKTYAMAARLLPARARDHVHAVYAFCRVADDIVDDLGDRPVEERVAALGAFGDRFRADLADGWSDHPVLAAVVATVREVGIAPSCIDRFLASMAMDFERHAYETYADLAGYMDGSAAVIGEMMLPVLMLDDGGGGRCLRGAMSGPGPAAGAGEDAVRFASARDLGVAFQLTNFLRDVGEDLDRGRVYLPAEDLARFGADPRRRRVDEAWRAAMRFEIARTREIYARAEAGIRLLPTRSARCVWTARVLYARILDRIEAADYDVFSRRVRVPAAEKAAVAVRALVRGVPIATASG